MKHHQNGLEKFNVTVGYISCLAFVAPCNFYNIIKPLAG